MFFLFRCVFAVGFKEKSPLLFFFNTDVYMHREGEAAIVAVVCSPRERLCLITRYAYNNVVYLTSKRIPRVLIYFVLPNTYCVRVQRFAHSSTSIARELLSRFAIV